MANSKYYFSYFTNPALFIVYSSTVFRTLDALLLKGLFVYRIKTFFLISSDCEMKKKNYYIAIWAAMFEKYNRPNRFTIAKTEPIRDIIRLHFLE